MVCTVRGASLDDRDDLRVFTITADRFIYKMVRSIVGTLIDIGRGRLTATMAEIIESKNRKAVGEHQPARRRRFAHGISVFAFDDVAHCGGEFSPADVDKRTHDGTHHFVNEPVGRYRKDPQVALLGQRRVPYRADHVVGGCAGGAKRREIVRAQKTRDVRAHLVPIHFVKDHPDPLVKKRPLSERHGIPVPSSNRRIARMKVRGRGCKAVHAYVVVEHGVYRTLAPRSVYGRVDVHVRALAGRVHARIGAARARHLALAARHRGERGAQRVLDARRVFLRLPPAVARAVVFDPEEIAHRSLP